VETPNLTIEAVAEEPSSTAAINDLLRDIARGGLAGLLVGIVVAGIGGRIVMRLAALLVPEATGRFTENGNRIGTITLDGSLALVVFVGLFFGIVAGSLWVVMRPWLPQGAMARGLVTLPIAVALGTRGLIDADNPDFALLGRDPVVIGSLVVLVALFGPALVLADRWLDARLPHPVPGESRIVLGYLVVTMLGVLLTLFAVLPTYLGSDLRVAGVALVVVGLATLLSWRADSRGARLPVWVPPVARSALVVATISGLWVTAGELAAVLGSS
jgi:hypothetical protein